MPKHTNIASWETDRPDYWAGERGGRPLPKRAPRPKRGDSLPRNEPTQYGMSFASHDDAIAYAKLFDNHTQVFSRIIYLDDVPVKRFFVDPRKGKVQLTHSLLGYVTSKHYTDNRKVRQP